MKWSQTLSLLTYHFYLEVELNTRASSSRDRFGNPEMSRCSGYCQNRSNTYFQAHWKSHLLVSYLGLQRYFPNTLLCYEEALNHSIMNENTVSDSSARIWEIKVKNLFLGAFFPSELWLSLPIYVHFFCHFNSLQNTGWRTMCLKWQALPKKVNEDFTCLSETLIHFKL